jgi:hypothetical protein
MKGEKWIRSQGWIIKDEYKNNRRPGLPTDLTITSFADMHFQLAKTIILENGGELSEVDGKPGFLINTEKASNIESLPVPLHRIREMRNQWWPIIQNDLTGDTKQRARAVYAAISLDLVKEISTERPEDWFVALDALKPFYKSLFDDTQWDKEAKEYFHDVMNNRNTNPDCPFKYEQFISFRPAAGSTAQ